MATLVVKHLQIHLKHRQQPGESREKDTEAPLLADNGITAVFGSCYRRFPFSEGGFSERYRGAKSQIPGNGSFLEDVL